jgi:PleD family two-component response regulator
MELKKVLLLDNVEMFSKILKKNFQEFEVFLASKSEDAIAIANEHKIDLIIVSGFSTEETGFDLAKKFRRTKLTNTIPIIMISSIIDENLVVQAFESGVNSFIKKNHFIEDLKEVLKNFQAHGTSAFHCKMLLISNNKYIYSSIVASLANLGIEIGFIHLNSENIPKIAIKNDYDYILIEDFTENEDALEIIKLFPISNRKKILVIQEKNNNDRLEEYQNLDITKIYFKPFFFDNFTSYLSKLIMKKNVSDNQTILVCDDSEDYRNSIANTLKSLNLNIITAENGEEGLEKISKYAIDLIITDLYMPIIDGELLTKLVKENPETKHIPIIIATNADRKQKIFSCFELGAADFISKPFSDVELIARIKRYLK